MRIGDMEIVSKKYKFTQPLVRPELKHQPPAPVFSHPDMQPHEFPEQPSHCLSWNLSNNEQIILFSTSSHCLESSCCPMFCTFGLTLSTKIMQKDDFCSTWHSFKYLKPSIRSSAPTPSLLSTNLNGPRASNSFLWKKVFQPFHYQGSLQHVITSLHKVKMQCLVLNNTLNVAWQ